MNGKKHIIHPDKVILRKFQNLKSEITIAFPIAFEKWKDETVWNSTILTINFSRNCLIVLYYTGLKQLVRLYAVSRCTFQRDIKQLPRSVPDPPTDVPSRDATREAAVSRGDLSIFIFPSRRHLSFYVPTFPHRRSSAVLHFSWNNRSRENPVGAWQEFPGRLDAY